MRPLPTPAATANGFAWASGSSWTHTGRRKAKRRSRFDVDRLRRTQRPRIIHRPAAGSHDPHAAVAVSYRKARKPRNAFRPVRRSVPSLPPAGCSGDSAAFAPARAQPHRTLALGTGRRGAGHSRRQPRTDAPPADPEDREPQVEGSVALPVRRRHDLRGEVPAGGRLVGRFPLPAGDGREKPLGTEPLSGRLALVGDDVSAFESPQEGNALLRPRPITFRCSTSRAAATTMPPSAVTFFIRRNWSKPTGRSAPGSARTSSRPDDPMPPGGCCPTDTTSTAVTRRWRS